MKRTVLKMFMVSCFVIGVFGCMTSQASDLASDDFNDGTQSSQWTSITTGGTVSENGGVVVTQKSSSSSYLAVGYQTATSYEAEGNFTAYVDADIQSTSGYYVGSVLSIDIDSNNYARVYHKMINDGGEKWIDYAVIKINGTATTYPSFESHDRDVRMKIVRSNDKILLYRVKLGTQEWVPLARVSGFGVDPATVKFYIYGPQNTTMTVNWDNFTYSPTGLQNDLFSNELTDIQWTPFGSGGSVTEADGCVTTVKSSGTNWLASGYSTSSGHETEAGDLSLSINADVISTSGYYTQECIIFKINSDNYAKIIHHLTNNGGEQWTDIAEVKINGILVTTSSDTLSSTRDRRYKIERLGGTVNLYSCELGESGDDWNLIYTTTGFSTAEGEFSFYVIGPSSTSLTVDWDYFVYHPYDTYTVNIPEIYCLTNDHDAPSIHNPSLFTYPVDGVACYFNWSSFEASQGTYNTNGIAAMLSRATSNDKKFAYGILAGSHIPSWVYTENGGNIDSFVYTAFGNTHTTFLAWMDDGQGGRTLNTDMLTIWENTVGAFANHISGLTAAEKARINYVPITGWPFGNGLELMLNIDDYNVFAGFDWDNGGRDLFAAYYKACVDIYIQAFTGLGVKLGLAFTDVMGLYPGNITRRSTELQDEVIRYAIKEAETAGIDLVVMGLWLGNPQVNLSPNHDLILRMKEYKAMGVDVAFEGQMGSYPINTSYLSIMEQFDFARSLGALWIQLWYHDIELQSNQDELTEMYIEN